MQLTRRKAAESNPLPNGSLHHTPSSAYLNTTVASPPSRRLLFIFLLLLATVFFILPPLWNRSKGKNTQIPLSSDSTISDDESTVSSGRLPIEDSIPPTFQEELITCMPTVSRGAIEYISNAVKSWRLATNGSTSIRRLVIFDMDVDTTTSNNQQQPKWLQRVFTSSSKSLQIPSWLEIRRRNDESESFALLKSARRLTLGDSESRVAWRSKEAQDYANVLQRCTELSPLSSHVLIVQDDVLFTNNLKNTIRWAKSTLREHDYTAEELEKHKLAGKREGRVLRICGGSLFDISKPKQAGGEEEEKGDGHKLNSSNMVARVWQMSFVNRVVKYIERNFDEKPVDWLVDDLCHTSRRKTLVMEPNAVRHRGAVSSFPENKRGGLLT